MQIPLVALIAYVPIILLVISLVTAPGGFGTAQATMPKDYGTPLNIMAFGLIYTTSILVLRYLIGLLYAKHIKGLPAGEDSTLNKGIEDDRQACTISP